MRPTLLTWISVIHICINKHIAITSTITCLKIEKRFFALLKYFVLCCGLVWCWLFLQYKFLDCVLCHFFVF